jgi:hypothetical protein
MSTRPPPTKPPPSPKKPEPSDESTKSTTPPPEDVQAKASTPNISIGGKDGGDDALERENQILSPDQVSESQAAAVEKEPSKSS